MEKLENYIKSKVHLPEEQLREITGAFEQKIFKKDQTVIQQGQYVTKYYFIASGGI